jgi:transposase
MPDDSILPPLPPGTKTGGHPIETRLMLLIEQRGGFEVILDKIADGVPIKKLAKDYGVSRPLLSKVLNATPERKVLLAQARLASAASHAEDALLISDKMRPNKDAAAKARVQIAHRQWLAQSLDRETFGKQPDTQINANFGDLYLDALRTRTVAPPPVRARIETSHDLQERNGIPSSEVEALPPGEVEAGDAAPVTGGQAEEVSHVEP